MRREVASGAEPEWLSRPERSNRAAIRFMVWMSLSLGRGATRLLLHPICIYFLLLSPKARAASREFLQRALGSRSTPRWRNLYRSYHCFASTILDRVFLLNGRHDLFDIRVFGGEVMAALRASGSGVLLLGAHLGSFEITRALGRQMQVPRISLLMYEDNARQLNSVLGAINPDLSPNVIALGRVDSMLQVKAALERGECVGMLADRTIEGEGTRRLPFLGQAAAFPTGPFRIAGMLRSPVVLMFGLYRGGNRYEIHFERLSDTQAAEVQDRTARVDAAQRSYVERLEHYARDAPYNWFNFYDFWK
jgi:predicted LPLAT superfamily acyltransferase